MSGRSRDRQWAVLMSASGQLRGRLRAVFRGRRQSATEADDLLQESAVKVYLRWTRISRTQMPEAYVRRMMVNILISRSRRPFRRRELLEGTVAATAVVSSENAVLDRAQVWPLVCALPVRQRAVIVLRYYEDLSEQEIADVLGCSTGSVKSQAHDALASLRRSVAAQANVQEEGVTREP